MSEYFYEPCIDINNYVSKDFITRNLNRNPAKKFWNYHRQLQLGDILPQKSTMLPGLTTTPFQVRPNKGNHWALKYGKPNSPSLSESLRVSPAVSKKMLSQLTLCYDRSASLPLDKKRNFGPGKIKSNRKVVRGHRVSGQQGGKSLSWQRRSIGRPISELQAESGSLGSRPRRSKGHREPLNLWTSVALKSSEYFELEFTRNGISIFSDGRLERFGGRLKNVTLRGNNRWGTFERLKLLGTTLISSTLKRHYRKLVRFKVASNTPSLLIVWPASVALISFQFLCAHAEANYRYLAALQTEPQHRLWSRKFIASEGGKVCQPMGILRSILKLASKLR